MLDRVREYRAWEPGDAPENHPLWNEQVALELEMVERGVARYRARVGEAREREEMTRLRPFQRTVEELVQQMAPAVKAWVANRRRKRGVPHPAFRRLAGMDPYVLSFITLRTILDRVTIERMELLSTAQTIGMEVQYEARTVAWMEHNPELYWSDQENLRRRKATSTHVKRLNIQRFNAKVRDEVGWENWSKDECRHVGLALIDILVRSTGRFKLESADPSHHEEGQYRKRRPPYYKPSYVLADDGELLDSLAASLDREESRMPTYLPTLMPPARWQGVKRGGYYTSIVRVPSLIRFKAENEETRNGALEEYNGLEMPRVMSALHYVQETPWRVNTKVLEVALALWDKDLGVAGIPRREPVPLPPKPADIDTNAEAEKEWKRQASQVYGDNARRRSKVLACRDTLTIAARFSKREFYFPHMLDFRGRAYPIPMYLQPQGDDLARGLLMFAKGQRLGEEGGWWLAVHLASCWGMDKVPFEQRVQFVVEREELWRRIAKDPLRNREWCQPAPGRDAKKIWQTLAAIFEWVRALDEGDEMVSALPIYTDGTCNGIQHLSAMMLDEEGGAAVNLIPGEAPRDIYQDVADKLHARLQDIAEVGGVQGAMAQQWLDLFGGAVPRSFTKRPVMILPYGGTREAYWQYTHEWLRETDPQEQRMSREVRHKAVPWIVTHLWDAVSGVVVAARDCMEWLRSCARVLAVIEAPIVWRTPSGFVVRHFYAKVRSKRIKTHIDDRCIYLRVDEETRELSLKSQLQGIPPNFVHSYDASAMTETVIALALDNEAPPIACIHDAFATVAGSMWKLFRGIRQAFVKVHSKCALAEFRRVCVFLYRDYLIAAEHLDWYAAMEKAEDALPPVPAKGNLDLRGVLESDYFFA